MLDLSNYHFSLRMVINVIYFLFISDRKSKGQYQQYYGLERQNQLNYYQPNQFYQPQQLFYERQSNQLFPEFGQQQREFQNFNNLNFQHQQLQFQGLNQQQKQHQNVPYKSQQSQIPPRQFQQPLFQFQKPSRQQQQIVLQIAQTSRPLILIRGPEIRATTTRTITTSQDFPRQKAPAKKMWAKAINAMPAVPEFDHPPPPPSRFLPDFEKERVKIVLQNQLRKNITGKIQRKKVRTTMIPFISREVNEVTEKINDHITTITTITTTQRTEVESTIVSQESSIKTKSKKRPNDVFLECCKRKEVDKKCESRCNYDRLTKKVLTGMFLGTDKCPIEHGLDLFSCAAQDSNHTECCIKKRVTRTSAKEKCLAFCNLAPEAPKFQADASYLPCWGVLNDVKSCFKESILSRYSEF